jgi:hypothetical protein
VYPATATTQNDYFPHFSRIHLEVAPLLHLQQLPGVVAVAAAVAHAVPVIIKQLVHRHNAKKTWKINFPGLFCFNFICQKLSGMQCFFLISPFR